jgi:hypothetical protein
LNFPGSNTTGLNQPQEGISCIMKLVTIYKLIVTIAKYLANSQGTLERGMGNRSGPMSMALMTTNLLEKQSNKL